SEQIFQFAFLFGQSGHILKYAGRDVVAPGQAGAFAALQIWELLDHVFPKLILPPGQLLFIAHNVFGAEPAVLSQRDKAKVHMGRFLVHMHHSRYNCLFGLMLFQKAQGFLEKHANLRPFLPLEELRAGSKQRLDHTDTVLPGTASGGSDLPFRFHPVLAGRFDQMKVVLASAGVHIGIAGVLFLCALVVGFDIANFWPLVLCKSHNRVLCFFNAQSLRFCQTMSYPSTSASSTASRYRRDSRCNFPERLDTLSLHPYSSCRRSTTSCMV